MPTSELDAWYEARNLMCRALERDLAGSEDDELLTERPLDRFVVGVLHPSGESVDDATHDEDSAGAGDDTPDPGVSLSRMQYPSSMGLTFALASRARSFRLRISANRYVARQAPTGDRAGATPRFRRGREDDLVWDLSTVTELVDVDLSRGLENGRKTITDGLDLRVVIRDPRDGRVSVTVVLVNTAPKPTQGSSDSLCWFRPSIAVDLDDPAFVDRPSPTRDVLDRDDRVGALLYRHRRHLATGHGCSVTWDDVLDPTTISTTYFPAHDVPVAKAERDDLPALGMRRLQDATLASSLLAELIDTYEHWVDNQEAKIGELDQRYRPTASENIGLARQAVARMRDGVQLVADDPIAAEAFRVMNLAMQEQRSRQVMIRERSTTPGEVEHAWRPFQIAFILMNLRGLAQPDHPDRDLADLLWFPTGGGKTEAYLGLIAFSLVVRRLRGGGSGVGVIMRYTLRLLTSQQFERAAGLICALEQWRRSDRPAVPPFSIGLWVGSGATPNDTKEAAKALRNGGRDSDAASPRQLTACPWCGAGLAIQDYRADRLSDETTVRCPSTTCAFHSGIPAHTVDTDVYRERPSLLIGTVDKFAMLPWREKAGRLLGADGLSDPPDMIIQDELHLISGPLGTLVGLYETAIDRLSTGVARPKLIASTATIRRATEQVRAVFAREAQQFPPPGLDSVDSFFAVDAAKEERGDRRYLGVHAPGTSQATLLVRCYSALLQAASELDAEPQVRDAYWTLVGYFTSLRVLGAAYIQSLDDVPDRIKLLARRHERAARDIRHPSELTSRRPSSTIPDALQALGIAHPDPESEDIVLATNMISVGVDVDRLGLMAVMGQPQTTSEYIQATSRVGRSHPGLVVTMFHATRSRDLSHFESFVTYHRSLYRDVESMSATPFSPRALDRGLHGVLTALARHGVPGAAPDNAVGVPVDSDGLTTAVQAVVDRAVGLDPALERAVRAAADALVDEWSAAVDSGQVRKYEGWSDVQHSLLSPAGGSPFDRTSASDLNWSHFPVAEPAWPTLTSLRNVDRECTIKIVKDRGRA